jgi:hypothetical protein
VPRNARGTVATATALGLLLAAGLPQPAAAFTGSGTTAACTPGFLGSTQLGSVAVVSGTGMVNCPAPGPGPGGTATSGPQPGQPSAPTFTPGADCSFTVDYPISFTETALGGGQPSNFGGSLPLKWFSPPARTTLGTHDMFVPWLIRGQFDNAGGCVPKPGTVYYNNTICPVPFPSPGIATCVVIAPHPVPGGPVTLQSLGLDPLKLLGNVKKLVTPGVLSSLPTTYGLVGVGTCFFLTGQSVPDLATLQITLRGTPDASGRAVYYVFHIELTFGGLAWDFGDGSTLADPAPPPQCAGAAASHTYRRYTLTSPDRPFLVQATEAYSAHVTEYWFDGQPGFADLGSGGIDPFSVTTPPLAVRILQEEGVPVALH